MGKLKSYKSSLGAFISSEKGQRFFNFAYSIGAAIVIWGALFKILHLPGGNFLLSLGMGTEVLMFMLTAFDKPPREYKWENVFPVFDTDNPDDRPDFNKGGGVVINGSVAGQAQGRGQVAPPVLSAGASPNEIMTQVTDAGFLIELLVTTVLFFIGGFLLYASIYAAIGSAVSNVQDASQLSTIATLPIIIGIIGSMSILNNPDGTLAFWLSIIPLTSPMAMMARVPYGVPVWELALSIVLLYATFVFMIWLCAKIYRVGIFMYGKKPSLTEIIKWARYK